ncbi:hypothetical protein E6H36_12905 [Candidatus Bathyarchaeota archaeon]|nr:MAG: hypothetical protein E6H36_12905 [Candidatus Bathyarchaeota archaeon]
MHLPTFKFQSRLFIKRLALVVGEGRIAKVFYPVFPANKNAELVLEFINAHRLKA